MEKEKTMSITEFYLKEVERMERQGYTAQEIEKSLDALVRVQNMVAWALR